MRARPLLVRVHSEPAVALLPSQLDGVRLRHAVEVRDASFATPAFIELLRRRSVTAVLVESDKHPLIADVTADFLYLRLQKTSDQVTTGYSSRELAAWAKRAKSFAAGGAPDDLATLAGPVTAKSKRDVFVYMISGAKQRAPAAAMALIESAGGARGRMQYLARARAADRSARVPEGAEGGANRDRTRTA